VSGNRWRVRRKNPRRVFIYTGSETPWFLCKRGFLCKAGALQDRTGGLHKNGNDRADKLAVAAKKGADADSRRGGWPPLPRRAGGRETC
jgi:hypothetical protein